MNPAPPSPETAISVRQLTRHFGALTAVRNVSFDVKKSAIFGFLGPNGSGKSTVVRMICGLLAPSEGDIWLDGLLVAAHPRDIRYRLGYMAQKYSLYPDLTVLENLRFFGKVYGVKGSVLKEKTDELVQLLGLEPYLERRSGVLSGGWKQRLALGTAMIHSPRVLFLDEPTAGIDPVARRDLWDLLFRLSDEGVTIFVTTHYMDEAERCTHVAYIYLAELLANGTPTTLKRLPVVNVPGESWLEVRIANPTRALSPLGRLGPVRDATIFGETLHLKVGPDWNEEEAVAILRKIGEQRWEFRRIQPSLEDVFVSLTRQAAEKSRV